ncbi:MAG: carbamoyltransferase C-terminal domain-containing protein [Candidatus Portnoybacteria bacterium]|nr:carbamoyltransferase C-terminal domain-containing protein [Candidatus Portnoybacteria bacterium]MDD4982475.1 carbamoyltransferase C-terminal domain-containing protein [Candidatus Portnoybacteria bacterium]
MEKSSYIVGIHQSGPIASAVILKDGKLVAGSPEERFTRVKQDKAFPHKALDFCLDYCKISPENVDIFAIGWNAGENVAMKYRGGFSDWMRYPGEWLASVPNHLLPLFERGVKQANSSFDFDNGNKTNIIFVDHHACHAQAAYQISGFEECALMVTDGWSEQKVTSWIYAKNDKLETIRTKFFPESVGCLYAALTDFLGYRPFADEWKVMGMAAYGNKKVFAPQMSKLVRILKDGDYELDLSYFGFYNFDQPKSYSEKMEKLFGSARKPNEQLLKKHYDIAAAGQEMFERVMENNLAFLSRQTGSKNLVLSGGTAMNCLFNGSVVQKTDFSRCSIGFAPDDSGNSIGAAFSAALQSGIKVQAPGQTAAIGKEYSSEKIGELLEKYKIKSRRLKNRAAEAADLLARNKVIGWFQGRSEFGQRALGHRSIFASPKNKEMKDKLNSMVKYREAYRPFAPMIPFERLSEYFETRDSDQVRYMEKAFKFREQAIKKVPAVVHQDGTGRLQTVSRNEEPLLRELLDEFEERAGVPVLLNTSFNLNGEPIVNSPEDALKTFFTSGIEALFIEDYLIEK